MKGKTSKAGSWNDVPHDILVKIFMTLNIMDLITSVSRVCSSWRRASCDPALWEKLDLSTMKSSSVNIPREPYAWSDKESGDKLLLIMKNAMSLGGGHAVCLILHFYAFLRNEHLLCAAERSPKLKKLALPAWNQLNVDAFEEAVKHWKALETLTVPCVYSPVNILRAIGTHCKNFSRLKIMCPFDLEFANAIITYIPKLKVLSLRCAMVYKDALSCIMNALHHLEVLNLNHCLLVDDAQYEGFVVVYREHEQEIIEKGSRFKTFLFCNQATCAMCQHTFDDEGILRWYEYDEILWRTDEVSSLAL
ncbi:F-box/LRR-repeat protein At3g48880 [Ziziphus jujuba]|nr:F-box/LRR-repeat protein At3g48880 [Ziziphus jujuba]